MNSKGLQCTSIASIPGTGGPGGLGGISTLGLGGNGGATGSGSGGVLNGGEGGSQGFSGLAGSPPNPLSCPVGISSSSINQSNPLLKIFLMGTSGLPGKSGNGGTGAGGGGAGSGNGTILGNNGQPGGFGGTGGVGGAGGSRGGGLILFKASVIDYQGQGQVYEISGDNGKNGAIGLIGGSGGFGAPGIDFNPCLGTGGSGGGGMGARGGQGGNGGSGAAGGYVRIIKNLSNRTILGAIKSKSKGGLAGSGGSGGSAGLSIPTPPTFLITPCAPSAIGGGGAIGSGTGSNIYNYSCDLSILAPISLGNSFGTGYYTGTRPSGNPFICSLDSLYQVGNLSYFQITIVETDLATGNNFYTNMVVAHQLGQPTSALIALIDAGALFYPNQIGNQPSIWISACNGFNGQDGQSGINGFHGEEGEGSGSEETEFLDVPLSLNQVSLNGFFDKTSTRLYWEIKVGVDKIFEPEFTAESATDQGQFSIYEDHIKGVLVGEKYIFNLKVPEIMKDRLFRVSAQLANGKFLTSNKILIMGSKSGSKIDVFPNPNLGGVLKFRIDYKPKQLVVRLTGLSSGKTFKYEIYEDQPLQIDIRDISSGIYSFEALADGKKYIVSKVAIVR